MSVIWMEPWDEDELPVRPSWYERITGPGGSKRRVALRLILIYGVLLTLAHGNALLALVPFFAFAVVWLYIITMCGVGLGIIRLWQAACRAGSKTAS